MNSHESHPALQIRQLSVNFDKTPILWDISLEIPKGKLVGIIGPNGAGKTTLIKVALGLIKPIAGKIEYFGKPISTIRKKIAYVPQRESVDWDFPITVRELVLMGSYGRIGLFLRPGKRDWELADHYLELVGMREYANRQISQLSGGQQQRVFLARAFLQQAEIYFLDEPFAGIDMASESMIMDLLRSQVRDGKTVFIVHHNLNHVETYFQWIIMLNMRLIDSGNVKEVFNRETILKTYGKSYALLDEALKLAEDKEKGRT